MKKRCSFHLHEGEQLLPLSSFYKNTTQQDGLSRICKQCNLQAQHNTRQKYLESYQKRSREYYHSTPERRIRSINRRRNWREALDPTERILRGLLYNAKRRAIKYNIPFTLTLDDMDLPTHCPILGIELKTSTGPIADNSPTLDQIVPRQGYTKENTLIISKRANTIKSYGTPEEHLKIYKFFTELTSP